MSRQKINKETGPEQYHKLDLIDFLRTLHPTVTETTLFSSAHGTFIHQDIKASVELKRNQTMYVLQSQWNKIRNQ